MSRVIGFMGRAVGALRRRDVLMRLAVVLGFAVCFATGWVAHDMENDADARLTETRIEGYRYVKPLLECDVNGKQEEKSDAGRVQEVLDDFNKDLGGIAGVNSVAVYYRDLNEGEWAAVDGDELFAPASLLKLPTSMAWFKLAEDDKAILQRRLTYDRDDDLNITQDFRPSSTLARNQQYTVEDLIRRSMADSDNNANDLLYRSLPIEQHLRTYREIGMEAVEFKIGVDIMSVKQYSKFFQTLFNATYLNRGDSEAFLNILSKSKFRAGLDAGVPDNILVAHKFGERELGRSSYQLHDCGIVYHPTDPYLLCVMTRGDNLISLEKAIREISRRVYEDVDSHLADKRARKG